MSRTPEPSVARSMVLFGAALALALALSAMARAEDWPQFRGPNRDGIWRGEGLTKASGSPGLKERWRQAVGWGYSSPVVAQGRVYVTDAQLEAKAPKAKERVLCFEEATGKSLWTYAYDVIYPEWAFVAGQHGGPCSTPVIDAGKIYVVGANGHVHCLEAQDGSLVWEKDLRISYEIPDWVCRGSPLIESNLLVLFTGAKPGACVLALDKASGQEIWKSLSEKVSNSSPLAITAGGTRQLIVWTDDSVASLNPASGEVYWREAMTTSNNDAIPTPVVQGNRLLIGGLMMALDADRPSATIVWPESRVASKRILSNTSTGVLLGSHVYSAKSAGELVCLDAGTGGLVWQTNTVTEVKNGASIHITLAGESAFLFTDQGNLIRASLAPEGYRELSRGRLIDPTTPFAGRNCAWTPPAYANRCVYARSEKELVCAWVGEGP